jgi:DNA-binding transcriptional LysR family regulator
MVIISYSDVMEMIEIEAFVAIATEGSFTLAAARLHLSQPAVSRRIELLEQELGAPLFERGRSGARLTPAGDAFLPFARQILAASRDGAAAVRGLDNEPSGQLSLALVGTLASTALTAHLRDFRVAYPTVNLSLRTARSAEISALVQQGFVDLGLRYFDDPSPGVVSTLAFEESLVVACAGDSRLLDSPSIDPEMLAGQPWVSYPLGERSSGEGFARLLERNLIVAGIADAEIVAIDSLTAQKRLIEAGFGLGLLPQSSMTEELRLGTLAVLPMPLAQDRVPVHVIHRRNGYLTLPARLLLASLSNVAV